MRFGKLALQVIHINLGQVEDTAVRLAAQLDCQSSALKKSMMQEVVQRVGTKSYEEKLGSVRAVVNTERRLFKSVDNLTTQGIMSFVIACFLQSCWFLAISTSVYYEWLSPDQSQKLAPNADSVLLGMGLMASSAAIGNVVSVEHAFEDALDEFQPFLKFWGTKVLVSIAFMQEMESLESRR
eukprot:gnl/TRDRNA2_/TRDRNA2_170057_c0_seq3.p1 gnl/TRDRNA2_/TRDRNA2_170057_c0~~gnl/TRDRNA2_/TRDRNA2_170057_c0_seq3.p1  ORF type:complete len:182 (-),score=39.76 gnl/TRDRNA2_/TRDRNA2_170057_c0_seq3:223-768(-)